MQHIVAALIVKNGKVLIARRSEGRTQAGMWEFPWGVCGVDETPQHCLERELCEALGLDLSIGTRFALRTYGSMQLSAYWAWWHQGTLALSGHDELAWAEPEELSSYDFIPQDAFVVDKLVRQGVAAPAGAK